MMLARPPVRIGQEEEDEEEASPSSLLSYRSLERRVCVLCGIDWPSQHPIQTRFALPIAPPLS